MEMKNKELSGYPDPGVEICGIRMKNPVIPASGCFGFGHEMAEYYDINILGGISLKGTTLEPRFGNPLPRVAECSDGILNAVGLQNPGIDYVINVELPALRKKFNGVVMANISGFSKEEYVECCRRVNAAEGVSLIELNVSCPNVHGGGMSFGTSCETVAELVRAVKDVTSLPVVVKLSPNVTDIVAIAKAAEDAGADGLCLINTLLGMRIDKKTRRPLLANVTGGYSGKAIFPIALRMVYQVSRACSIPVIGCGGISTAEDVAEMMMAGAKAVEVGTANLINPLACKEIIEDLPRVMDKYNIELWERM